MCDEPEFYEEDDSFYSDHDEESDRLLEQQELDDFCQDGYFENMEAWEIL